VLPLSAIVHFETKSGCSCARRFFEIAPIDVRLGRVVASDRALRFTSQHASLNARHRTQTETPCSRRSSPFAFLNSQFSILNPRPCVAFDSQFSCGSQPNYGVAVPITVQ
jgi:hypothetical protein